MGGMKCLYMVAKHKTRKGTELYSWSVYFQLQSIWWSNYILNYYAQAMVHGSQWYACSRGEEGGGGEEVGSDVLRSLWFTYLSGNRSHPLVHTYLTPYV